MPTSPGSILPGSTPAAASSSVLKGLFTLQGAALLGAGAWLFLKGRKGGKATRKNPLTRGDLYTNSAKLQKAKNAFYAAYDKAWNSGKTKLSYGDWQNSPAGKKVARRIERENPGKFRAKARRRVRGKFLRANEAIQRDYNKWWSTSRAATGKRSYGSPASWARKNKIVKLAVKAGALGPAAKSVTSQARRHQGIFRRSWFKTYGKTLENPSSKTAARYEARMRNYFSGKGRMPKATGLSHDESWAIIWKIQDERGMKRSVPIRASRINPGPYLKIAGTKYDNDEAGWRQLADAAHKLARIEILRILEWNDRNGTYSDADCDAQGMDRLTKEEALELLRNTANEV